MQESRCRHSTEPGKCKSPFSISIYVSILLAYQYTHVSQSVSSLWGFHQGAVCISLLYYMRKAINQKIVGSIPNGAIGIFH
jgi:hypothetical protein